MILRWMFLAVLAVLPVSLADKVSAAETYEVTGIAADDALVIRVAPKASSKKAGRYGPDDKDIQIYRRKGNWALTGRSGQAKPDGWVNMRYLKLSTAASPAAASRVELPMTCLGTEPFWSLTIDSPENAAYSDPEIAAKYYAVSAFQSSKKGANLLLDGSGQVSIKAGNCSDGMSDTQFPYSVRILFPDGREVNGCCG
ncbi:MAG: hypothetical protein ACREDN_06240 [Aestuariivirga sp.]